jgi:hypothetical protein
MKWNETDPEPELRHGLKTHFMVFGLHKLSGQKIISSLEGSQVLGLALQLM